MIRALLLASLCMVGIPSASAQEVTDTPKARPTTTPAQQAPTSQPTTAAAPETLEPPLYSIDTPTAKAPPSQSQLAKILRHQLLRICVRADIPPFGMFRKQALVGFDIALAQALAVQLSIYYKKNLRTVWSVIDANARVQSLTANHCDLVLAAFSQTPDRAKKVAFSEVYLKTYKVQVKKAEIARRKPVMAVVRGTTSPLKSEGVTRIFRSYNEILRAMERGEIDTLVTDQPIAIHLLRTVGQGYVIGRMLTQVERYAVGVNKKNKALLKAVNQALQELATSGRLAYLQRQWL